MKMLSYLLRVLEKKIITLSLGEPANISNRIASRAALRSPKDEISVDHVVDHVRYRQTFAMT